MFATDYRRRSSINQALGVISQNLLGFQNGMSTIPFNNDGKNFGLFAKLDENYNSMGRTDQENCIEMEEAEPRQFCNMKENILRLEELAKKNGISLDDDSLDNGQCLFNCEMNPSTNIFARRDSLNPSTNLFGRGDSLGSTCWFNAGRRFSGLKPEHLLDEHKLSLLVYQFGLEHVRELPELPMEAINKCLLTV